MKHWGVALWRGMKHWVGGGVMGGETLGEGCGIGETCEAL